MGALLAGGGGPEHDQIPERRKVAASEQAAAVVGLVGVFRGGAWLVLGQWDDNSGNVLLVEETDAAGCGDDRGAAAELTPLRLRGGESDKQEPAGA